MKAVNTERRSMPERIFHAITFEVIATSICAPVGAFLLDRPLLHMGALSLVLATIAMLWNIIYNAFFDYFWPASKIPRTLKVRACHALGFEAGFIVTGVTIAAWLLKITLTKAFLLEIGFFLFFLPYTMFYNWSYDVLRQKVIQRRQSRMVSCKSSSSFLTNRR